MNDEEKIFIEWRVNDDDPEHKMFELYCLNQTGEMKNLLVQLPQEGTQERAARAKLITMMFEKAEELGIDVTRLRFHV